MNVLKNVMLISVLFSNFFMANLVSEASNVFALRAFHLKDKPIDEAMGIGHVSGLININFNINV